jgi:DNA-directed RNA polymerase specialized sigma24 family protein
MAPRPHHLFQMGSVGASVEEIGDVYRRRAHGFFRLAYAHTGDGEKARDAVQEGFANAFGGGRRFAVRVRSMLGSPAV